MHGAGFDIALAKGDVSSPEEGSGIVRQVEEQLGPIDILVNNAGITRDTTFHKMRPEQWMEVINTNLNSVYNMTRPVIEGMRDRKWGRVIQIASINGQKGQYGQANYAAAKAGIASLTIVMARELERIGARVNAICPVARTRLTEQVAGAADFMSPKEGEFDRFAPENISAVAGWLASDLSTGVTGQVVKVMGGQVQLLRGWRPITESTDEKPWTIESIETESKQLFAKSEKGVPPFMPNVGDN